MNLAIKAAFAGTKALEKLSKGKSGKEETYKKDNEYLDRIRNGDYTAQGRFIMRAINK